MIRYAKRHSHDTTELEAQITRAYAYAHLLSVLKIIRGVGAT
jgi:hypothetical protein